MNASPPLDVDMEGEAKSLRHRDGYYLGERLPSFPYLSSHSNQATSSQTTNPMFGYTGHSLLNPVTRSTSDGRLSSNNPNLSKYSPQSPNMVYLRALREFIDSRKGVLGEGWHVEFEFCDKRCRTSAVYVSPNGNRFKSMVEVAHHLGLPQNLSTGSVNTSRADVNNDYFPIQFQDFCILTTGSIDPRPSYHSSNQIWPVGYSCSWHDKITGSLFVGDLAEGGEGGPIFKVRRYPCTKQSIPSGSYILSCKKTVKKDDSVPPQAVDDDSESIVLLLNEDTPPRLENCEVSNVQEDTEMHPEKTEDLTLGVSDLIGEFQVEGRSSSHVWEMVAQSFTYACHEVYKQKGAVKFFCDHDAYCMNNENLDASDSLSRYSYYGGPTNTPRLVRGEREFNMTCELLVPWLKLNRFGLDEDFVQEIVERLPGLATCSGYRNLNDRIGNCIVQTVGSGFFHFEKKRNTDSVKTDDILRRGPCPSGKPLNSKLPPYLMGDALQVWELAWRFSDVLGLGQPFSFHELESELLNPCLDSSPFTSGHESYSSRSFKNFSEAKSASLGKFTSLILAKIQDALLKLLVSELLSKVAVYVCPNLDAGESKSRRGKKKDLECLAALKKTKLDMLPVNDLTWPEFTRRYVLAVLSMEGNIDFSEFASRESGKVFHCLRGDGGVLCGALTGVAALEADAVILADAMRGIFGSLKAKNEIFSVYERESETDDAPPVVEVNDGVVPEWVQVLEPVRKLPTNVGARIRKCVNEALDKNPPEWAKNILEQSISKDVYKGNASGPTKRAVLSLLARVSPEDPQPKADKKEKVKIKTNLFDLITKQCRIVLRRAAAMDEDRVFCNLLGRTISRNDTDDEGLIGYPGMVSRPLDFRTIDLRLAAGAYCGSHEMFIDDVREVWSHIRTAYGDNSDLIKLAEKLSKELEDLYDKEVVTICHKISEFLNLDSSLSDDSLKERDELICHVSKSSLPRAPWEEEICKVCGMDKDDDNVLLCDKCDSEYHRYCLNPPLLRIPEGNWYCPSCVTGRPMTGSITNQGRKKYHGEFMQKLLDSTSRLANLMEIKEHWEFTVEERIFFMKFLFDEALNSSTIRDHMDQCASRTADLQQKLRSLTSELRVLKFKEEFPALSADRVNSGVSIIRGGDLKSDASSSSFLTENTSDRPLPMSSIQEPQADMTLKKNISDLQESIASVESELLNLSIRKDFMGRDTNGRVYWAFYWPNSRPCIVANGGPIPRERPVKEFSTIPDSDQWTSFESDTDIEKLVNWLREDHPRERELRESITQLLQSNKLRISEYHDENHFLSRGGSSHSNSSKDLQEYFLLGTKAKGTLEKRFGKMYRCACLELLWPSKHHCLSCHNNFTTSDELREHSSRNCKVLPESSSKGAPKGDDNASKRRTSKNVAPKERESGVSRLPASEKQSDGCPFTLEEIMARFIVPNSVRDAVNKIGLIGGGGIPKFVPNMSSLVNDPALALGPTRPNAKSIDSGSQPKESRNEFGKDNKESKSLGSARKKLDWDCLISEKPKPTPARERDRAFSTKNKTSVLSVSKSSIVRESSQRPIVAGKGSQILTVLKTNLLDMDAALPDEALRISRSNQDRRYAWRAFVRSARTLYEMVQAVIAFEDMIRSDRLASDMWYWSSPSTAAKITTLSALALRIYVLDSAIYYDKSISIEPNDELPPNLTTPILVKSSSSLQKTLESDPAENPRTRSRTRKGGKS